MKKEDFDKLGEHAKARQELLIGYMRDAVKSYDKEGWSVGTEDMIKALFNSIERSGLPSMKIANALFLSNQKDST